MKMWGFLLLKLKIYFIIDEWWLNRKSVEIYSILTGDDWTMWHILK